MVLRVIKGVLSGVVVGAGVVIAASQILPPVEIAQSPPDSSDVAVPAGSGFNAELPDTAPMLPQTEGRPSDSGTSMVAQPGTSESPSLDTSPASAPEAGSVDAGMTAPENSTAPMVESGSESEVSTSEAAQPAQPLVDATPAPASPLVTPGTTGDAQIAMATPTEEASPIVDDAGADATPNAESGTQPDQPNVDDAPASNMSAETPETGPATTEIAAPAGQVDTAPLPAPDTPAGPGLVVPKIEDLSPGTDEALPRIGAAADTPVDVVSEPALTKYAEPFENSGGNPILALILSDLPGGVDVAELADFPVPITIVIDPTTPGAGGRMAALRGYGIEIAVLAPLPEGATPADVEVSFQSFMAAVPQSVAVMDVPEALIQESRPRASQVIEILKVTGHGLVTYEKGLNAALQIAESEDVAAASVFRTFDDGLRNGPAMKRFLDQGAFRAGQVGPVILVGLLRAETLAAVTEWSLGNRASTVALAPLSAVLTHK